MTTETERLPVARLARDRRPSAAWLVPILALLAAAWLAWQALEARGRVVEIAFDDAHGLEPGDPVRYRGLAVGTVRRIRLAADLGTVIVECGIVERADDVCRAGSRFWIERPRLDLAGAAGLDTVVGPKYVAVRPGPREGAARTRFDGLASPPAIESSAPGDLEIVLDAERAGSVRAGTPVTYRQVRVGTVLSVGLSADAGTVEIRVHVPEPYRALVRERTVFWLSGAAKLDARLSGLTLEVGSIAELVAGGISLATPAPDRAGAPVLTGHRFRLVDEAPDDWLSWRPASAVGLRAGGADAPPPPALRAVRTWTTGMLLKRERTHQGWACATALGLVGPADLLGGAEDATPTLEILGRAIPLDGAVREIGAGIVLRPAVTLDAPRWPREHLRAVPADGAPEDCIAVIDGATTPMALSASRLAATDGAWIVDAGIPFDEGWHGAAIVAQRDGALVGVLLVEDGAVRIAPIRRLEGDAS